MHRKTSFLALMALLSLVSISAPGQSAGKTKVKGIINSRTGETLVVKTTQGNVTVVLTDSTKTKDNKSLGMRSEKTAQEALIPGLKVDVDGTFDTRGQVVATGITVDGDDVETSQMIQAGLTPTAKLTAANAERIEALERRLAAVEHMSAHAAAPAPAATVAPAATPTPDTAPAPDTTQASAEAAASPDARDPAAEPASAPSEAPKTSFTLFWVGLTLLVLIACGIGFVALRRGK